MVQCWAPNGTAVPHLQGSGNRTEEGWKDVRAGGCGDVKHNGIFGTRHSWYTLELTASLVICTRPIQDCA